MIPSMSWRVAAALAMSSLAGCHPDEQASSPASADALAGEDCEWLSAPMPEDADAPICDLSFREIVRLEGDVDGVIPQYPILVLRDGGYVTGTYSRGKLALWSPDWHRPTRDMMSIIILEAVLTGPG